MASLVDVERYLQSRCRENPPHVPTIPFRAKQDDPQPAGLAWIAFAIMDLESTIAGKTHPCCLKGAGGP